MYDVYNLILYFVYLYEFPVQYISLMSKSIFFKNSQILGKKHLFQPCTNGTRSIFYLLHRFNDHLISFSPVPDRIINILYRVIDHLISFFHPFLNRILIFCIVLTIIWFHSFTSSQIELYVLHRFNNNLILIFPPLSDQMLIFYIVLTITWFYSFPRSQIDFLSSILFKRSLDFILPPILRLNFYLLYRFNDHLISFF